MSGLRIAVVGAGIVGLSTALNIMEVLPEAHITIIADKFGTDTTSNNVAGLFRPTAALIKGMPVDLVKQWAKDSFSHYNKLVQSPEGGSLCGCFPISGFNLTNTPQDDPMYRDSIYKYTPLSQTELDKLGTEYKYGYHVTTLFTQPSIYMPWLMRTFKEKGGRLVNRKLNSLEELVGIYDVVAHCSGLGAKWLVNDQLIFPLRGHLIYVKAPWMKHFIFTDDDNYILPICGVAVLGGVRQKNNANLIPDPADHKKIWDGVCRVWPSIAGATIEKEWVGLRPQREPIRIEQELMNFAKGPLKVVHNYGHGSNGIALSWGTSIHAAKLVKDFTMSRKARL